MLKISLQFFGGRGGGGGKGSGGGGASGGGGSRSRITESYVNGSYTTGTKVKFNETDTRYTVSETGERISKSAGKVVDFQRKSNPDGTATLTNIVQGSKGNLYAVDYTYRPGGGSNGWTSEIRKVKRRK